MRRWLTYDEAHADLASLEPAERLPVLLEVWRGETTTLDYDEMRRLFILAWAGGAAPRQHDHDVLVMLRWLAPVRDTEEHPVGAVTIYRGHDEVDPCIRWTLDHERAAAPGSTLVRATVHGRHVLAHFNASGEGQVLVDPEEVQDVEHLPAPG